MSLTDYMIRKLRGRMREEAMILEAVSDRLGELHRAIPAPDLEELHAMETGAIPVSLAAFWISVLSEHENITSESSSNLFYGASASRASMTPRHDRRRRPYAKVIAHLRSGLLGRTLPEDFRPEFADDNIANLLRGQSYSSSVGVGMVRDLLAQGYTWGG